jgi:hypothetical protein
MRKYPNQLNYSFLSINITFVPTMPENVPDDVPYYFLPSLLSPAHFLLCYQKNSQEKADGDGT